MSWAGEMMAEVGKVTALEMSLQGLAGGLDEGKLEMLRTEEEG